MGGMGSQAERNRPEDWTMIYSDFAIEELKKRLAEKGMKGSTPKKFACDMFEAFEVIRQLQAELAKKKAQQDGNPN